MTSLNSLAILPCVYGVFGIALLAAVLSMPLSSGDVEPIGPFFSPVNPDSLTEGDYISALHDLERASRISLVDPETRIDIARLYIVTREYEKAIRELETARGLLGQHQRTGELEMMLVELYVRLDIFDKPLEYLVKNEGSDFLIGYCHERNGEWQLALEHFSLVASTGGELNDLASYHKAYCLYQLERYEEAFEAFRRFDDDFPLSIYTSFAKDMIPSCYEGMKKYRKAIHLRNEMMRKNPGLEPEMRYHVGQDYEMLKDKVRAREEYTKVITRFPKNYYALLSLDAFKRISEVKGRMLYRAGRVCYYRGEYSRAKDYLNSYVEKYPKGKRIRNVRYLLGQCYLKLRMYSDAETSFESLAKSVASQKERARYLFNLAKAQDKLGRNETAAGSFGKVAEIKASSLRDDAMYREGLIKEEQGNLDEAIKTYMRVDLGDYVDNALYRAGTVALSIDKYEVAADAFRKLVYLHRDSGFRTAAKYWLAVTYEELDSLEIAQSLWRSVASSDPFGYYGYKSRARLGKHEGKEIAPAVNNSDVEVWISTWAPEVSPRSQYETRRLDRGRMLLSSGLEDIGISELDRIDTRNPINAYLVARAYTYSGLDHRAIPLAKSVIRRAVNQGAEEIPKGLLRIAYPLSFLPSALKSSEEDGIDPFLLLAMMREESLFMPDALSSAGAIGLMQIMPRTGKNLAEAQELEGFQIGDLYRPTTSVSFGSRYMGEQLSEFKKLELAIASYNAGPAAVRRWTRRFSTPHTDRFLELMPYPETRVYVKKVLASWWTYQYIWGATSAPGP